MLCDVVGCEAPGGHSFLKAELHRSVEFHICLQHFTLLVQGLQPAVVADRLDLAQLARKPGLLMPSPAA